MIRDKMNQKFAELSLSIDIKVHGVNLKKKRKKKKNLRFLSLYRPL